MPHSNPQTHPDLDGRTGTPITPSPSSLPSPPHLLSFFLFCILLCFRVCFCVRSVVRSFVFCFVSFRFFLSFQRDSGNRTHNRVCGPIDAKSQEPPRHRLPLTANRKKLNRQNQSAHAGGAFDNTTVTACQGGPPMGAAPFTCGER